MCLMQGFEILEFFVISFLHGFILRIFVLQNTLVATLPLVVEELKSVDMVHLALEEFGMKVEEVVTSPLLEPLALPLGLPGLLLLEPLERVVRLHFPLTSWRLDALVI
ncbi:uncharacterized protein DS421_4g126390 [Arachis hypogaea]|nr:uncharacterized protein DS421_4g126390 [Arachis hypogaea]